MSILRYLLICLLMVLGVYAYADGVPDDCTQLIVGIGPTWDSPCAVSCDSFERARGGDWTAVAGPFPVLFGKAVSPGAPACRANEPGLEERARRSRACGRF